MTDHGRQDLDIAQSSLASKNHIHPPPATVLPPPTVPPPPPPPSPPPSSTVSGSHGLNTDPTTKHLDVQSTQAPRVATETAVVTTSSMMPSFVKRAFAIKVRSLTSATTTTTSRSITSRCTDSMQQKALLDRKVLFQAFQAVLVVLRNSLGCLTCAWATNFCYSLGNIFSGRPSKDQSTESVIVASLVWTNALYSVPMLLTQTAILAPLRFACRPDVPAGVLFAMKKLVKATLHYYLVASCRLAHGTCKGQEQQEKLVMLRNNWSLGSSSVAATAAAKTAKTHRQLRYWRLYLKSTPKVLITVFAGIYVQIASQTRFLSSGAELLAFTVMSLALKILIQELAKVYVMRRGIQQMRFMCVLLGLPTVLIDTQVRIVMLLGGQSSNFAKVGSVAMAAREISMRVWKMWLVKFQIRRRGQTIQRAANALMSRNSNQRTGISTWWEPTTSLSEFERWKRQMLDFHTAEIMADMYAEYIAISCSASILFFFANHPKYMYADTSSVGGSPATTSGSSDTAGGGDAVSGSLSSLTYSHFKLIGFQVALEIVVDYVACTYEIASGIPFVSVRKFSSFLAFLFMTIAVVNINMSSFLYLK